MPDNSLSIVESENDKDLEEEFAKLIVIAMGNLKAISDNQKKLLKTDAGRNQIRRKYESGRRIKKPSAAKLKDDQSLHILAASVLNLKSHKLRIALLNHKKIKACENAMGKILEGFLSGVLGKYGWRWSSGHLFEKTDFVRLKNGVLERLQVKNRSNTENAASRKGRGDVIMWHRFNPAKGEENWATLSSYGVSEKDINGAPDAFLKFVRDISARLGREKS
jgi:hypothetical protein